MLENSVTDVKIRVEVKGRRRRRDGKGLVDQLVGDKKRCEGGIFMDECDDDTSESMRWLRNLKLTLERVVLVLAAFGFFFIFISTGFPQIHVSLNGLYQEDKG
ncbi:hypothetical protein Cni_G16923 [Canna indica]|uniref:Uncharacterized protein n=1 Tax=Canna indica TaxID=4628 RepID=A0AAQ3KLS9_9LILI|nr:hypothetical protein Cni_G16923 [Canna indica]